MAATAVIAMSALFSGGVAMTDAFAVDTIQMKPIFSDNMVLQREKEVEIYGTAEAGAQVTVTFKGQNKSAIADGDGNFSVKLDKMTADGNGATLTVSAGSATKSFSNVLVGEVYYGSGQSNMAYSMDEYSYAETVIKNDKTSPDYEKYNSQEPYIEDYKRFENYDLLRFYTQKMLPETDGVNNKGVNDRWIKVGSVDDLKYTSHTAVAYAIHLSKALGDIPVGVIVSAVGGSQIHEWISKDAAKAVFNREDGTFARRYENMNVPMGRFTIRGVLWYQGESDVFGNLEHYKQCFAHWLSETRAFYKDDGLPVINFQLPQFEDQYCKGLWAAFREVQEELANEHEGVYMVCGIDLGDHSNIHPLDKYEFNERAVGVALKYIYGKPYGGKGSYGLNPVVNSLWRKKGTKQVYMRFDNAQEITVSEGTTSGLIATSNRAMYTDVDSYEKVGKATVGFQTKLNYVGYLQNNIFDYGTAFIYNEYGLPVAPFAERTVNPYDYDVVVKGTNFTVEKGYDWNFVNEGDDLTLKVVSADGGAFKSLTVDGVQQDYNDGVITLTNIGKDVEIVCEFAETSAPDTPVEPGNPDNPDTPDTPGNPDNPDTPDTPDNPDTPGNSDNSDNPDNPGNPEGHGGCGGSISAGVGALLGMCVAGAAIIAMKKKN